MTTVEIIERIVTGSIGAGTGLFLSMAICNHYALHIRDHPAKFVGLQVMFLSLTGGLGWLGASMGLSLWTLLPAIILLGLASVELRNIIEGFKLQGARPVSSEFALPRLANPITTTHLGILRYEHDHPACPVHTLRIVHLTDIHLNDSLPADYYLEVAERVNAQNPDIVVYTGDFVSYSRFIPHLNDMLSRIESRMGQYAILGNHDYWSDPEQVKQMLATHNIHWVGANPAILDDFDSGGRIIISGCETPWGEPWTPPISEANDLLLTLSHTPDTIYQLSETPASAVFAGHCHAGQFHIPLIGPIVTPSHYGRRFIHGHYLVKRTHLYLSAGIGASSPALRIYCNPDFFVVDIHGPHPLPSTSE